MNKFFALIIAVQISHSSFSQTAGHVWTFDCGLEQWADFGHSREFKTQHQLATESVNSGHLEFRHQDGDHDNWLFGPTALSINANENKHIHFSLTLSDAGSIPESGIGALLVWTPANNIGVLHTKSFQIVKGQHNYHIDLSDHADWKGNINLNRIHFPQGDFRGEGYTPETAVYALDWFAIVSESNFPTPTQDTSSACIPEQPALSNPETVVFGNRVSMKVNFSGNVASAQIKLWQQGEDTLFRNQDIKNKTALYFSFYDLKPDTNYSWKIGASNSKGTATTEMQTFTTETMVAEDMPMKFWMTPSPFLLAENVNDDLFDQNNWEEAAGLVDVYKIHGAFFNSAPQFYRLNIPKLIYTINKYRMRLAWETIVQGERDGQAYADDILEMIGLMAENGGKLEFLTWDGMMFRCFYASHTNTKFRTPEEGLEVVAEACRIVKNTYPDFEIIPLPNLPNWDIKDANGSIVSHNAGDWAGTTDVPSWDYLCDIFLEKAKQKGVDINFIEIDHPFNYYHRTSREVSVQRVSAINDYCTKNDMELIHIINSSGFGEITTEQEDARFNVDCMQYLQDLKEDGLFPKYVDVESWYPYPQYLTPETKENSFTNVLRDVGNYFSCVSEGNGDEPCLVTGFEDLPEDEVMLYPNPTLGAVYLEKKQSYKVYNMMGRLIDEGVDNQLNLGMEPSGIYMLRIENRTLKIIVSH